jgi:hypothetical protein
MIGLAFGVHLSLSLPMRRRGQQDNTYRACLGDLQAMCKRLAADYGGDLMHQLLGLSGVCGL